jgi:hypothetical protein
LLGLEYLSTLPTNHRDTGLDLQSAPIIPSMASSSQSPARDQRLDFWRGLCLVDMLLVHLYYQNVQFGDFLGRLLGEYTRFAAGGFIFVSGLSIGVIFLPRAMDDKRRGKTYESLWRRSIYILAVNYLCAMVLIIMEMLIPDAKAPTHGFRGNFVNPMTLLRDIFFLREGGDLLPFYVMMIALSPFLLAGVRRRLGWFFILIGSVALFVWGLWHPWALALAQHDKFPPVLWQIIFVAGFLLGYAWPKYNAMANKSKLVIAAVAWFVVSVLFVMEYSYQWGMPQLSFNVPFTKVPLSTAEGLRYLCIIMAIITTTDLLWPMIGETSASAFVQTLGRKSLPVYVLHLWVVQILGALAVAWPWMGAWQILFAGFSLLILWLFALILDISKSPNRNRTTLASIVQRIFRCDPIPGPAR